MRKWSGHSACVCQQRSQILTGPGCKAGSSKGTVSLYRELKCG